MTHGVPREPPKQPQSGPVKVSEYVPLHVSGPVKPPESAYDDVQPPGIVPVFEKLPDWHVVGLPVKVTGFDGELLIEAPLALKMNDDTERLTSPIQHV